MSTVRQISWGPHPPPSFREYVSLMNGDTVANPGPMDSLVLLGDSLFQHAFSQGLDRTGQLIGSFGPRLSEAYIRRLDVLNRGLSGYNTRKVLSLLESDRRPVPGQNVRFAVILLGANDSRLPDTPGGPQQHVPLEEFGENLGKIVALVKSQAKPRNIVLITPPPVDERLTVEADSAKHLKLEGVVRRKAVVTAQYARCVREVAREKGIALVDIWGVMMEKAGYRDASLRTGSDLELGTAYLDEHSHADWDSRAGAAGYNEHTLPGSSAAPVNEVLQSYLHDGLHFTRKGYDLLFDELISVVEKEFPDQMPDKLPFVMPAWDDGSAWDGQQRLQGNMKSDAHMKKRANEAWAEGLGAGFASCCMLYAVWWIITR